MNGTVYKKGKTWAYSLYAGKDENGKPKRIFKSGFKTKREADDARNQRLLEMKAPPPEATPPKPPVPTLAEFVVIWFKEHAERNLQPKTVERYREQFAMVAAAIAEKPITELTAFELQQEINRLRDSGGRDRKTKQPRPLSPKSVKNIAAVLRAALNMAQRWDVIKANPILACTLPKQVRREAPALDPEQVETLLDFCEGHWMRDIFEFAAGTGCRRGEVLALTWRDLNLEAGQVRIDKSLEQTKAGLRVKSTKTEDTRFLSLSASLVAMLQRHRMEQEKVRAMFGPTYRRAADLVFCGPGGECLKPDTVTAEAARIARKAKLPGATHILRHSHGSQLLAAGVPLAAVSKRLGHSSPYVTATIYTHAFRGDDREAATKYEAVRQKATEARRKPLQ